MHTHYRSSPQPHLAYRCGEYRCLRLLSRQWISTPLVSERSCEGRTSVYKEYLHLSSYRHSYACHRMCGANQVLYKVIAKSCTFVVLVLKINSRGRKWFRIGGNCAKSGTDLVNNCTSGKKFPVPTTAGACELAQDPAICAELTF